VLQSHRGSKKLWGFRVSIHSNPQLLEGELQHLGGVWRRKRPTVTLLLTPMTCQLGCLHQVVSVEVNSKTSHSLLGQTTNGGELQGVSEWAALYCPTCLWWWGFREKRGCFRAVNWLVLCLCGILLETFPESYNSHFFCRKCLVRSKSLQNHPHKCLF